MKMQIALNKRLRLSPLVTVLLALMGIALIVAVIRYAVGIGAISNLNNAYPWGFWVSFDLYTGIAISSGAFIITAMVYIFELEQFRPLVRPTLLTGLLGYIMEVIALLVDLGHPERIWHYFVYQNFSSFLLVIGLYVMAYSAIMLLEFAPVVFERYQMGEIERHSSSFDETVGDCWSGHLHPAPGCLGSPAPDPTGQIASALVDTHPAGIVFHLRPGNWPGNDAV